MRVGVLFSGGKDSTFAVYSASRVDSVECLITLWPERQDSYMFHYPSIQWTRLQAKSMGIPQVMKKTGGVKELELGDLKNAIDMARKSFGLEGIYTGALASIYQKSRVDKICTELRLKCLSPLWMIDPVTHLRTLLKEHFRVMVTGASALGLSQDWLGRIIDENAIEELVHLQRRYGLNPGFEGGEAETFVLDCPMFRKQIEIISSTKHWRIDFGFLEITKAQLAPKS